MKKLYIAALIVLSFLFTNCKKYDEDGNFSTFTPKGRLTSNGTWILEKMQNLNTGNSFIPAINVNTLQDAYFKFENNQYEYHGNIFSYDNYLCQYTNFLKPIFQGVMTNTSDSIILGNGSETLLTPSDFIFSDDKSKITMKNFLSFGQYTFPQYSQSFYINQSIDLEFVIIKLEYAKMVLEYDNILRLEFKKINLE